MTRHAFLNLLDRYIEGSATPEERQLFDRFYDQFQKDKEDYWSEWELNEAERIKVDIFKSLSVMLNEEVKSSRDRGEVYTFIVRFAAAVAVFISVGLIMYYVAFANEATYIVEAAGKGQKLTFTLKDGTVVKLNSGSSITFPEEFSDDSREVTLTGEAFFEVSRDTLRPFLVRAGRLQTRVLGTSFNVNAYEKGKTKVTVASGTVAVSVSSDAGDDDPLTVQKAHGNVILTAGEQAVYTHTDNTLTEQRVSLERFLAWKDGIIYLDNTRLEEVVEILRNWYDADIKLLNPAIGSCLVSGKYKSDPLIHILESLQFMHGIEYVQNGSRQFVLKGNTCNQTREY